MSKITETERGRAARGDQGSAMTHVFPCTDCGAPTPTKLRKPKRCAPCAKVEALDYSRWNYRAHRDELLAYHRKRYAENRERILAQRAAKERRRAHVRQRPRRRRDLRRPTPHARRQAADLDAMRMGTGGWPADHPGARFSD